MGYLTAGASLLRGMQRQWMTLFSYFLPWIF